LEQRFTKAQGQCDRIADFSSELERWRDNLRFADIRARVALEQDLCKQADALMARIADLGMDCAGLRGMADTLAERAGSHFDQARSALKTKLRRCDTLARYERQLKQAGSHCGRLKALERDLKRQSAAYLEPIRERLAKRRQPCRPKPKAALTKPPRGSGAYALSGQCSGNLVIAPAGGYDGDRVRHIVSIAAPGNARIAKVVSDNRGCRNCRLTRRNATTWSVGLFYGCSGRGPSPSPTAPTTAPASSSAADAGSPNVWAAGAEGRLGTPATAWGRYGPAPVAGNPQVILPLRTSGRRGVPGGVPLRISSIRSALTRGLDVK
jgi:hypothetical protein